MKSCLVADNGSTMRTIQIGTLGAAPHDRYERAGFNVTVSTPPMELRLRIGSVTNPENADFGVGGRRLENKETLRYGPFTQDEY